MWGPGAEGRTEPGGPKMNSGGGMCERVLCVRVRNGKGGMGAGLGTGCAVPLCIKTRKRRENKFGWKLEGSGVPS